MRVHTVGAPATTCPHFGWRPQLPQGLSTHSLIWPWVPLPLHPLPIPAKSLPGCQLCPWSRQYPKALSFLSWNPQLVWACVWLAGCSGTALAGTSTHCSARGWGWREAKSSPPASGLPAHCSPMVRAPRDTPAPVRAWSPGHASDRSRGRPQRAAGSRARAAAHVGARAVMLVHSHLPWHLGSDQPTAGPSPSFHLSNQITTDLQTGTWRQLPDSAVT